MDMIILVWNLRRRSIQVRIAYPCGGHSGTEIKDEVTIASC